MNCGEKIFYFHHKKIELKTWKIQQNWTRLENFDINFCVLFDFYCQILISGRKTGDMSLPKFEIFLIFPNLRRSLVLRLSATRETTRIPSFLY